MNFPLPQSGQKTRWPHLSAGALPMLLAHHLPESPLKLILTPDAETALRLQTAWQFFRPQDTALFLPDWETLPYERFSPHQDLVSERLSVLWQLKNGAADVLFAPVATAMQRLAPPSFLLGRTFWLKTGQTLDLDKLRANLVEAGYAAVSNVVAAGEFAVRGGIVDLFPMGADLPYRLDLFDDEIDSIKTFDTDTQRTLAPVSEIRLLPAHEFPTDADAQKIFRNRFREEIPSNPNEAAVYQAVGRGQFGAGVEYYLPLFFEDGTATLFDYVGGDALAVCVGDVHAEAARFDAEVKSRYKLAQGDAAYPPLPPQFLYLPADRFSGSLKAYPQVWPDLAAASPYALPNVAVNRQSEQPLAALQGFQTAFDGRILLCAESAGRRETMLGFFAQHGLKPKPVAGWQAFLDDAAPLCIAVTLLAEGFKLGGDFSGSPNAVGWVGNPTPAEAAQHVGFGNPSYAVSERLPENAADKFSGSPNEVGRAFMPDADTAAIQSGINARPTPEISGSLNTESSLHPVACVAQATHADSNDTGDRVRELRPTLQDGSGYLKNQRQPENAADKFSGSHNEVGRALMPDADNTAIQSGMNARPTPSEFLGSLNTKSSLHLERLPEIGADTFSGSPNADQGLPENLAVITESELYQYVARARVHNRRKKHAAVSDGLLRDLAEINIGDPVVHEEHGIGRYKGLVTMDLGGDTNEMMLLEYAGEAQLYVPVSQLHLISRYSGQAHENVQLHKLGSAAWNKAKRKAAEKARDTAAELLNLYAQRAAQSGHKFEINELDYQAFADGFGYEETEDQAAAIAAVIKDLTQAKPMDRLVCGDVGFGKTEVALRAAFVAVMGGKQVAVLAPTTLLVEQHAQNFADRFADFPVKVASLSRFNNSKATKAALDGMADGTVDIVIGTHKLVQDDIKFKNLGLVIIDEEHRFGVRQKEQLKRLRANVDVLTMTATPIPRTLSMALEGLRDFSLITTAPSRRLAVKTFVKPFSEGSVREAVLRELKRGGQVFFLHNEVDTIENMRERLETLLPEARIGVAHGQLRERELEQVMRDFLQQKFNVLLCSTIIETGIDIPNANTIIIHRADKFGLAQLHQLRGRVGRSHHQAYAYLLTPEYITKDAEKRLDAIAAADELGAGFTLAMQDLEIRGAGEILGEGQSGEMIQVGFTLYTEMLKQAVRDLKKGRQPDLDAPLGITTEIKLHSPALLPEDYCPDIHERLVLYKRLAVCETVQQINTIHEELVDRFGLPEQPVKTLIESHHLRLAAKELGIDAIDATSEAVTVTFGKHHRIDPTEIIMLIQSDKKYRLAGADRLRFTAEMENIEVRINTVKNVLKTLKERVMKE
ncbi:transcription-repair coupling factor [Eikenella sp. S3360]|uniref:Transcription-repair-coupling factor n=1 Tax=Eikenella glucosivorans TaxID=2766967 RepID=A0ABS0N7R5_9NEIS|nr:transcription-repair coupling factor [Eikenella glucosivorans]MBH5328341.1 transcription-repair coupling factor [Eikenella glucosivorans]